jgi:hypothetical protein
VKRLALLLCIITMLCVWCSAAFSQSADKDMTEKRVNFELKDAPVRAAIDTLFKWAPNNVSYAIDQAVTGTISASLKDLTFDQALKTITRQAGLTYTKENGGTVYLIKVKKTIPDVVDPNPQVTSPEPETVTESDRKVEKIALNYADAQDIAVIFGGSSFSSRSASLAGGAGNITGGMMGGGSYGGMGGMGGMFGMGGMGGFGNSGSYGGNYGGNYGGGNYGGGYGGRMGF